LLYWKDVIKICGDALLFVSVTERRLHLSPGHDCKEVEWKHQCLLLRIDQFVLYPIRCYNSQNSHGIIEDLVFLFIILQINQFL